MMTSVAAPFAGVAGAQQSAPAGMVGVPSTNVTPVTIGDSYPGGVEPTTLTTAASDWSTHSSKHAGDLELAVGEVDGNLALVFSDDANHAGREVAVDATTLADTVGYRPQLAYGLHENGSRWTAPIRYENGHAVLEVPKFSSNTVTFSGEVTISGNPSMDGSSYSYDLADLDSAGNFTIDVTGDIHSQTDNESASDVSASHTKSVSLAGTKDPTGPSANNKPTISAEYVRPSSMDGSISDATALNNTLDVAATSDDYAVAGARSEATLTLVDMSDPANPTIAASVTDATALDTVSGVAVGPNGNYAYAAASGTDTLAVVDISDRTNPAVVGSVADGTNLAGAVGVDVGGAGDYVYVTAETNDRLTAVDVSTPSSPAVAGSVSDSTNMDGARRVAVDGNYAYVTARNSDSLTTVDVSSPSSPAVAGSVSDSTVMGDARGLALGANGDYAYVTGGTSDTLAAVDVTTVSSPTVAGSVSSPSVDNPRDVEVSGSRAYLTSAATYEVTFVDISSPSSPSVLGAVQDKNVMTPFGMAKNGATVYVGGWSANSVAALDVELQNLAVDDDAGHSAALGTIRDGQQTTVEFGANLSTTSLSWTGAGGHLSYTLHATEHTETVDPTIEVNSKSTGYSGTLADGSTASLSTNTSWLQEGENTVNVTVGDGTLSSDAPTPQVGLAYSHDTTDKQSVQYEAEAYSERYNVSKTYASDRSSATLTVPFATTVVDVRNLETRTNGGTWSTVASSDYSLSETELTVQLGSVTANDTVDVRTTATKVQVTNGSITVTEPTVLGESLASKIRIDSYSTGFALDVNATAYNDKLHYTHSESWTNAQSYASVSSDGSQSVRMPQAGAGETTRLATIPLAVNPSGGQYDVRVSSAGAEPELQVRDTTTADSAELVWKNTDSGSTYQLYSLSADEERDRGTAQSPVTLTHSGIAELLVIYDLGGGGGGGDGGGSATSSGTTIAGLQPVMLIGAAVGGLALLFIVSRRYGDGSLSDTAMFGAGALIIGILAVQALAPEILAAAIGGAIQDAGPLIVLGLIAAVLVYLRQRGDDVTLNIRGGN